MADKRGTGPISGEIFGCRMKRRNAVKYINVADKPTKKHLKEAIEKIPFGDIKKLQGIDNGYRLRVGDLKVLFSIEDDRIYIDILFQKDRHIKGYRNRPDNTVSWQNAGSGFGNSRKKMAVLRLHV